MAQEVKKFLDQKGVELLWSKLSLEDYPNNDTLIAVINAIDKNKADKNDIMQADWDENDETSAAYVKNKTHYYCDPSIYWDGNTEGLEGIPFLDSGGVTLYYKVSDYVPSSRELIGQTFTITSVAENTSITINIDSDKINAIAYMLNLLTIDNSILLVYEDSTTEYGEFFEKGVYFSKSVKKEIYVSAVTLPIKHKQLDEKFIPDSIARTQDVAIADWNINDESNPAYVKNRTHYEKSGIFWDGNTEGLIQSTRPSQLDDYFYKIADYTPTPEELIGHTVKFYDGSEMEGIIDEQTSISMFENNNYIVYIGPYAVMAVATVADEDFGAPSPGLYFYYLWDDIYTFYCSYLSELKQLDEKFIPDSIARTADVNTPKDFIIFKDRSTGTLYYGGMDNGNWVTWCDVDHIKVTPAIDNMNYIEGMKLSKEDFIVTAFYIDGSSKHITEYDLIVDEILTLDSTNVEVVFTFNGKSYSDNITFTVVELDSETKNMLTDFQYYINGNNTYTLTDWHQTYNGNPSTEVIIPDNPNIIL